MNQIDENSIFKALSDCNRLGILDMLSCGELCACRLLDRLSITQPTLSHHMKVLAECGLVSGRKEGIWMYYRINTDAADAVIAYLQQLLHAKEDCCCKEAPCECCTDNAEVADVP